MSSSPGVSISIGAVLAGSVGVDFGSVLKRLGPLDTKINRRGDKINRAGSLVPVEEARCAAWHLAKGRGGRYCGNRSQGQ